MSRNIFFLLYFAEKTNDGKWPFFLQKPWTNPFGKLRFFLLFSCPENILLYPENHETVFLSYFAEKKTVLPSPLTRRFVVGTRFGFLRHWKALEPPEQMFEGSLSLRKNESKGRQHGWQAQYGLGWAYPLFVPLGKGSGYFSKICMGWFSLPYAVIYQF